NRTQGNEQRPVVLAAGGTGGHIFPAEALAEILINRGERILLVTDSRFGNLTTGVLSRIERRTIRAGTVAGSLPRKVMGGIGLLMGMVQAKKIVRELNPRAVVGFGGYPSFPTVYAAAK